MGAFHGFEFEEEGKVADELLGGFIDFFHE